MKNANIDASSSVFIFLAGPIYSYGPGIGVGKFSNLQQNDDFALLELAKKGAQCHFRTFQFSISQNFGVFAEDCCIFAEFAERKNAYGPGGRCCIQVFFDVLNCQSKKYKKQKTSIETQRY